MKACDSALKSMLVPPAGRTGTFNQRVKGEHVCHLTVPTGRKVAVVETVLGEAKFRAGRTLAEFERDNTVVFVAFDGTTSAEEQLGRNLVEAEIVFFPHPDAADPTHQKAHQAVLRLAKGKVGVCYETADIGDVFDFYVPFTEGEMQHKMQALSPYASQLSRVRFDLAAKFAARAAAEEMKGLDLPQELADKLARYSYAERAVLGGFLKMETGVRFASMAEQSPGSRAFVLHREVQQAFGQFQVWNWDWFGSDKKAFYFSPHHDDEIPLVHTLSCIARKNLVHVYIMTTGQAGINTNIPWQEKSRVRDREHFAAASEIGVLSSPLNLWHDYPVPRPLDQKRFLGGTRRILEGFLTRWAPEIIFRPMPGDLHPDHVLTSDFVMKVAEQAIGEGVWGRNFPNVFSYASPWYSGAAGANAYFYFEVWHGSRDLAAEPLAQSNAIVGTEVCMNVFGIDPPLPQVFGGPYAEKMLIKVIGG